MNHKLWSLKLKALYLRILKRIKTRYQNCCYEMLETLPLAQLAIAGDLATERIEDELSEMYQGVLKIWFDHYDDSMEIGFADSVPKDFRVGDEIIPKMKKWGISLVYCNFTDNTQQYIQRWKGQPNFERRDWGWDNSHRWSKEKADQLE